MFGQDIAARLGIVYPPSVCASARWTRDQSPYDNSTTFFARDVPYGSEWLGPHVVVWDPRPGNPDALLSVSGILNDSSGTEYANLSFRLATHHKLVPRPAGSSPPLAPSRCNTWVPVTECDYQQHLVDPNQRWCCPMWHTELVFTLTVSLTPYPKSTLSLIASVYTEDSPQEMTEEEIRERARFSPGSIAIIPTEVAQALVRGGA